jgi:chitin disaccharide deacetylase
VDTRLIVNADDFGLSAGVNRGVVLAHEDGVVTSASLMVRRPAAPEAAGYARGNPRLSLGLHLDLGEWVYADGEWNVVVAPPASTDAEARLQLDLFRDLVGREPTHLDSHQHVHREEPAASALAALATELAVPLRGRDARIAYRGDFYGKTPKGEPVHTAISVAALLDLMHRLPEGTTELGCHPGVATDDDKAYGRERELELHALCDPRVQQLIGELGITLCSFTDLVKTREVG